MKIYRVDGINAYRKYVEALTAEHAVAHELAECTKVKTYTLLAADLFNRVGQARLAAAEAFENLKHFEDERVS